MFFPEKLAQAQRQSGSRLVLRLDLAVGRMPLPLARVDDPLLPFARSIIDATRDVVCGYVLDPAYFLADGAAGVIALERIAAGIPADRLMVFDARFGHLGPSAPAYARAAREAFGADAVTFSVKIDRVVADTFARYAEMQLFHPYEAVPGQNDPRFGLIVEQGPVAPASAPLLVRYTAARQDIASDQTALIEGDPGLIYASRRDDYEAVVGAAVLTAASEFPARRA